MLTLKRCREPGRRPCLARPGVSEETNAPGATTCSEKLQLFLPCGPSATPVMPIDPLSSHVEPQGNRFDAPPSYLVGVTLPGAVPLVATCFQLLREPFAEPDTQVHDQGRGALQLDGSLLCFSKNTGTFSMVDPLGRDSWKQGSRSSLVHTLKPPSDALSLGGGSRVSRPEQTHADRIFRRHAQRECVNHVALDIASSCCCAVNGNVSRGLVFQA